MAGRVLTYPERVPQGTVPGAAAALRPGDRSTGERTRGATDRRPAAPLRIGHLNVRSLMPSLDDVMVTLNTEHLDILCVSETWLRETIDSRFIVFPGYKLLRRDRDVSDGGKRRGGGVAIIYRETMRVEQLAVTSSGSLLETLWATV